jgi:hypothetical protein
VVRHADLRQPYVPRIDCELLLKAFLCTGVMSKGPEVRTAADLSDEELGLLYHFDRTLGRIWDSYRLWHERPRVNDTHWLGVGPKLYAILELCSVRIAILI